MARVTKTKHIQGNVWLLTYEDGTTKLVKVDLKRLKEIVDMKQRRGSSVGRAGS